MTQEASQEKGIKHTEHNDLEIVCCTTSPSIHCHTSIELFRQIQSKESKHPQSEKRNTEDGHTCWTIGHTCKLHYRCRRRINTDTNTDAGYIPTTSVLSAHCHSISLLHTPRACQYHWMTHRQELGQSPITFRITWPRPPRLHPPRKTEQRRRS